MEDSSFTNDSHTTPRLAMKYKSERKRSIRIDGKPYLPRTEQLQNKVVYIIKQIDIYHGSRCVVASVSHRCTDATQILFPIRASGISAPRLVEGNTKFR